MITKTISPSGHTLIHCGPKDLNGVASDPPADVTWAEDTNFCGDVFPVDAPGPAGLKEHCLFQTNGTGHLGETIVTMAQGGKTAQVKVIVAPPPPGPFDHFEPSFD